MIANIVKCLALLNKIPEALEHLKSTMGKEMSLITKKTAQQISEIYTSGTKNILKELFEAVMEQMKRVVEAHTNLLDTVKSQLRERPSTAEVVLYTKEDVWSQVQTVVRFALFIS